VDPSACRAVDVVLAAAQAIERRRHEIDDRPRSSGPVALRDVIEADGNHASPDPPNGGLVQRRPSGLLHGRRQPDRAALRAFPQRACQITSAKYLSRRLNRANEATSRITVVAVERASSDMSGARP